MQKKRLKIGDSDYKSLIESNGYFIDKTLFIKEVIDEGYQVLLLPRPRRFGKTLNLSMLRYYFDVSLSDTQSLFEPFKIWQEGAYYTKQQSKYPVIHLSLRNAKGKTYKDCYEHIKKVIIRLYRTHIFLLKTTALVDFEKEKYEEILRGKGTSIDYQTSLLQLSQYLSNHYQERVIILLDEYDTPIHSGYANSYYDDIISFLKSLMGSVFKDNPYLQKGVITGILRLSKESIFSDLNNIGVYTLLNHNFSDKFGFTETETIGLLKYFDCSDQYAKIKTWYDGYVIGKTKNIYNPWSIINYVYKNSEGFKPHWVNTSSDLLIREQITKRDAYLVRTEIEQLIKGLRIKKRIDGNIVFSDFLINKDLLWSLLVFSGYLIPVKDYRNGFYDLRIPNYEIITLFRRFILDWLNIYVKVQYNTLRAVTETLTSNRITEFKKHFKVLLADTFSYFDINTEPERVYQAYVLGLLTILGDDYIIKSNREAGDGRYDILMLPHDRKKYGAIIEIKTLSKEAKEKKITQMLATALEQIQQNKYYKALQDHQTPKWIEMAMVFVGKEVYIKTKNFEPH